MQVQAIGARYLVRLDRGESYPDSLVELARQLEWKSGSISAIGGVESVELAYYDLAERLYLSIPVSGMVELVSMTGNLSTLDESPLWHCHAVVGNRDGSLRGGHLSRFIVALTVECWIEAGLDVAKRELDDDLGLNLLSLK